MRLVVQRVSRASVKVEGAEVGVIQKGLLVFLGVAPGDGELQVTWAAAKIAQMRVFEDRDGKMNLSLEQLCVEAAAAGTLAPSVLLVSQFTLFGDLRRGRRPAFSGAGEPGLAKQRYLELGEALRARGLVCAMGTFQADMQVELLNDGPVTMLLDSDKLF